MRVLRVLRVSPNSPLTKKIKNNIGTLMKYVWEPSAANPQKPPNPHFGSGRPIAV